MENPYERLLVDLVRGEVRFLVVGGVACALAGHVRSTEDVDILVDGAPDNVSRLLGVLAGFGAGHARELQPADFSDEEGAIRIIEDFPLDVFTRMGGRRYSDLLPYAARRPTASGFDLPFLGAEGLILVKGESLRDRDRMDVAALRALLGK